MKYCTSFLISCIIMLPFLNGQGIIPDDIVGTWAIHMEGEGEVPSQIFRYSFSKESEKTGTCTFYWLFKRATDKEFIVVAATAGDLNIEGDKFTSILQKAGTMQKEPMKMDFYNEVRWFTQGDDMFEKFPKEEVKLFKVEGDKLILRWDYNGDGDFEDEGEHDVFEREQ